jgi:hypothetical protein
VVNRLTGQVVVKWGKQQPLSTSVSCVALRGAELTAGLNAVATEIKDGKPVTKQLAKGTTLTYVMGVSGPTMTLDVHGAQVSLSLNRTSIVIAMQVTVDAPAHNSLSGHPVTLAVTTTLTPLPPTPKAQPTDPKGIVDPAPAAEHQTALGRVESFFVNAAEGHDLVEAWHAVEHLQIPPYRSGPFGPLPGGEPGLP